MRCETFTFISDTHDQHDKLTVEPCFFLAHTGDATGKGQLTRLISFLDWFALQPACYKFFVPGNHDSKCFRKNRTLIEEICTIRGIRLLMNSSFTIPRPQVTVWGAPLVRNCLTPYDPLPESVDVLLTHEPAFGILDKVDRPPRPGEDPDGHIGTKKVLDVDCRIHAAGHIHEGRGFLRSQDWDIRLNASSCDRSGNLVHDPISVRVYLNKDGTFDWGSSIGPVNITHVP